MFFDHLILKSILPEDVTLSFRGHVVEASVSAATQGLLSQIAALLEFDLPTFLSVYLSCFVRVDALYGTLGGDVEFRLPLRQSWHGFTSVTDEARQSRTMKAVDLARHHLGTESRLLHACLYYQQALRHDSPHECTLPALHIAEVVMNLAKSLEMLFPGNHDNVRAGAQSLGYTPDEIERNIIPILKIRNEFDIAHPVSTSVPEEDVNTVHDYIDRSKRNVRSLLLRVGGHVLTGSNPLKALPADLPKRRIELCRRLREHMQYGLLPEEDK